MWNEEEFSSAVSRISSALENNNVGTLSAADFRVFIDHTSKRLEVPQDVLQKTSDLLFSVLSSNQLNNDSQVVVATAYSSTVASHLQDHEEIFKHFSNVLQSCKSEDLQIYLSHGILLLNNNHWTRSSPSLQNIFQDIFKAVKTLCYKLKSCTFLAFKVLNNLLRRIHQTHPHGNGVTVDHFREMLDIVMSNWENPLSGVRQQNSLILGQLLMFENVWTAVLRAINDSDCVIVGSGRHQHFLHLTLTHLPWTMKSKYFVLTALLDKADISQVLEEHSEELVAGLVYSLSVPHLVSAGTDLYRTLLARLSLAQWCQHFLPSITHIITNVDVSLEMENLFNYWISHTVKKLPDTVDKLLNINTMNIYCYVTIQKVARKDGYCNSKWEMLDKSKIKMALVAHVDKIRAQTFSLLCIDSKTSILPCMEEFEMVKQFLRQNVSSDNSALRQSLLNSFTNFTIRIKDSLLYVAKTNSIQTAEIVHCFSFLDWLHSFLLFNLQDGCNYQRKVTSLEIYKIILIYFGQPSIKKETSYKRKSNKDHLNLKLLDEYFSWKYCFESDASRNVLIQCLFDEDNDVRSSSASILMTYFKLSHCDAEEFKNLFQTSLSLCSSQMFYKAESGALITQVLVTLALKCPSEEFKQFICHGKQTFLSLLLSRAEEQFKDLQDDLLRGAAQGSFLYGTLQALTLLLTDPSSPEYMGLDHSQLERLVTLMEQSTQYFLAVLSSESKSGDNAPSFGEMGMAIAAVVEHSSLCDQEAGVVVGADDLQLTPAHQLVLSCVWLNIKEVMRLSCSLVGCGLCEADVQRCLAVVVAVLRRCRHKGAIESAGLALHQITRHITTNCEPRLLKLPDQLLEEFLQSVSSVSAVTVSRRSAGLAILVHRLITGDFRNNKPLLHRCVAALLPLATDADVQEQEVLADLPQSQALHFLRTLVQESSLREHMAQYTLSISLAAVTNLASPVWTIRNAALQLFGALVPKLVGQKPNQEDGRGSHYLAFEELYMYARPLVEVMSRELSTAAATDSTVEHSKLMPLLTLLVNMTTGLQAVLSQEVLDMVDTFRNNFKSLFRSKIFNVRKLSAKAHALFLLPSELVGVIYQRVEEVLRFTDRKELSTKSENEIHWYLLNIVYALDRFDEEKVGMKNLLLEEDKLHEKLRILKASILASHHCYFVKSLIYDLKISPEGGLNEADLYNIGKSDTEIFLGLPHFFNKQLTSLILQISYDANLTEIVRYFIQESHNYDVQLSCIESLKLKLELDSDTSKISIRILRSLASLMRDCALQNVLNVHLFTAASETLLCLLEIIRHSHSNNIGQMSCSLFLNHCLELLSDDCAAASKPLLPLVCAHLSLQKPTDLDTLQTVVTVIKERSFPKCDQELRLNASKSTIFIVPVLKSLDTKESTVGEHIWEALVNFLQDEITEVRLEASRFVSMFVLESHDGIQNPYVSLECLMKPSTLAKLMEPKQVLKCLWERMVCIPEEAPGIIGISNPFDHGIKSIFAEETVISDLAYHSILNFLTTCDDKLKITLKSMCKYYNTDYNLPRVMNYIKAIDSSLNIDISINNT